MAAGCAGRSAPVTLVTGVELPAHGQSVWIVGVARTAKLGAVVEIGRQVVSCDGQAAWP